MSSTTVPRIEPAEFEQRRQRAAAEARRRGLRGLLVCARGGGALDRYGDVLYLSNFYSSFPCIPDVPGVWTGRGYAFVVLTAEGEGRLVVDCDDDGRMAFPAGQVVKSDRVLEALAGELRRLGLERGRVGLVGADVLPASAYLALSRNLPDMQLEDAQTVLAGLRAVKSSAEIGMLRHAAKVGSRMIDAMLDSAVPGASHGEVVAAGMQVLLPAGGMLYNSFMASGAGGPDAPPRWRHFPTWGSPDRLEAGHWLDVGISGMVEGYFFDLARSGPIGRPSNRQVDLFEAAIATVEAGIAAIRPGVVAEAVAKAAFGRQRQMGFALDSDFAGMGHGLGLGWDSPWLALGDRTEIVPGMVLCIERTVGQDGFAGDFEETVVVTEAGVETITDARIRRW